MDIPSARTLYVSNRKLKSLEIEGGNGIKSNVKENEGPLEESVNGICYVHLADYNRAESCNDLPPATLWTLCWIKKYIKGNSVPKKHPASLFLYFTALGFCGLSAMQPMVHGRVATR